MRTTPAQSAVRIIASVFLLIGLGGCAMTTELKRDAPPPDDRGMVVLHLASSYAGRNWDEIEVWSETEKRVYRLYRELVRATGAPEYSNTAVMIGALPTGTYRLDALKDEESNGNVRTTYTAPVGDRLGRFRVEAGRVTDLGTVLFYPEFWYLKTGDFLLIRLPRNADTQRTLGYKNPVAYAALGKLPALGWLDERGVLSAATLTQVKASLPRLYSVTETRNGDLYVGAMLGQVLKRPAGGAWVTLDTGTHEDIFRVVEGTDGVYAVGERALLKSADGGRNWKELKLPAQDGRLEFFSVAPDGTQHLYFYTAGLMINEYSLFTRKQETDPWSHALHTSFDNGLQTSVKPSAYQVSERNGLRFTAGGFHMYVMGADGHTLERRSAGNFPVYGYLADGSFYGIEDKVTLSDLSHHLLLTFIGADGKGVEQPYEFKDTAVHAAYFIDRNTGYVVTRPQGKGYWELLKTADGGRSWVAAKSPGLQQVLVTRAGEVVVVGDGIYQSTDGGKNWKRDHGSVNLLALSRETKANKDRKKEAR